MSLTLCHDCVMLAKSSSAYRTGYACGDFARMPCPVKDLGHFPRNLLQNPGLMNAVILAGGNSSRMGFDKTFIKVGGLTLIERQIKLLYSLFEKIIVVTNNQRKSRSLYEIADKNRLKNVEIIQDIILGQGPLGGIYSGLKASNSIYNFVVACDMPFINERLVKYMIKNVKNSDVFIPRIDNKLHPLCGVYSKNCVSVIGRLLLQDRLKVSDMFSKLNAKFISKKKLQSFDKDLLCLENINTPEDIKKYK